MLKLASDADVHGVIVDGLAREEDIDIVRVIDALPEGTPDPEVLEWAAGDGRILLTNDRSTMIGYAWERVRKGQPMPGLLVMPPHHWSFESHARSDVRLIAEACDPAELQNQVVYLPLKEGQLRHPQRHYYPPIPGVPEAEEDE